MSNYPPGVYENTRGAPWNEYAYSECAACGRIFYHDERPRRVPDDIQDRIVDAPETAHGIKHGLCADCEIECSYCEYCGRFVSVPRGARPGDIAACYACKSEYEIDAAFTRAKRDKEEGAIK